jgi:hypothetical protein
VVSAEGLKEGGPLNLHGAEVHLASNLLIKGGRADRGRATGAGQDAAALEGVKMLVLREGEERLMAEGGRGIVAKESLQALWNLARRSGSIPAAESRVR